MSNKYRVISTVMKYGISAVLVLVLAYTFVAFRVETLSDLALLSDVELYRMLCDAFTIPGMLFLMAGLLMTVSNAGALDGVGYVVSNAVKMLIPGKAAKMERYKEYLDRKRENRPKGYGFLYVVGGATMAVAMVFLLLFYQVY